MIPARRSRLFLAFFTRHVRSRIAKRFCAMRVRGLDEVRKRLGEGAVIVVSNHTSWWDPLVALHLSVTELGSEAYALMDAANLRKLPFFAWIGAFGVDLEEPRDGARALRYAARLLKRRGVLVWIFPQGKERPITAPIAFRGGAGELGKIARGAVVVPVALRYELGGDERPVLYASFGDAIVDTGDREERRLAQEDAVNSEMARIEGIVRGDRTLAEEGFVTVVDGSRSRIFAAAQALLAFFSRPRLR